MPPPSYKGEVILIKAKFQYGSKVRDSSLGWSAESIGDLKVFEVNSHHGDILFHPAIEEVYEILRLRL
jgi:hypothetical protein